MRKLLRKAKEATYEYTCNYCMRHIRPDDEDICGFFTTEYEFGYETGKDGELHRLDLHEECFAEILAVMGNTKL